MNSNPTCNDKKKVFLQAAAVHKIMTHQIIKPSIHFIPKSKVISQHEHPKLFRECFFKHLQSKFLFFLISLLSCSVLLIKKPDGTGLHLCRCEDVPFTILCRSAELFR